MTIKQIFDEISAEGSTNKKMEILSKYKDNETLKRVLYLANSKRIKFYIKQIPEYVKEEFTIIMSLDQALDSLVDMIAGRKVTGHDAQNVLALYLSSVSHDDAYIIKRIIEKDCKIGMGTTFINKIFNDLVEQTPYMGCISFDEKKARGVFDGNNVGYSQIKMDGRYCNAIIRNGEVELESRSGEPTILTNSKLIEELSKFDDCVLNGELTVPSIPRYESNGMIASIIDICGKREERGETETNKKIAAFEKKHGSFNDALNSIVYTVWDTITIDEYFAQSSELPYVDRLENVYNLIKKAKSTSVQLIESRIVTTYADAMSHFQEVLATEVNGVPQEGTILKASNGVWKDGKRSNQIKMKLEMDVDLKIVGFNYGTKGTKNENVISSLNCESSDGLVKTRPQGLKEDMMKYITENQDQLLGKIIQCRCNGLSKDVNGNYSLLYPAFVMVRDDKDTCDSLESIKQIENMVKSLEKA